MKTRTIRHLGAVLCLFLAAGDRCHAAGRARPYPRFNIGVTGIWAEIPDGTAAVTVLETQEDTPAHGKFEKGDVIKAVNGEELKGKPGDYVLGDDPRRILGEAIGQAEATDGRLMFQVQRRDATREVTVVVPVLGAYSKTWPLKCRKSEAIIQQTVSYLRRIQTGDGTFEFERSPGGSGELIGRCLSALFLLSTEESTNVAAAGRCAHWLSKDIEANGVTSSSWPKGYMGLLLAEYYLKTGDKGVLKALAAICRAAAESQVIGAWGHGNRPGPGYAHGGVMNSPSLPILMALILARECNVEVDEGTFERALRFFSRFPGQGCSAYGDQRGDAGISNGKDAMTATVFSLLPGEDYGRMATLMALQSADSYHGTQAGHGGCHFNVIWRGLGAIHLPDELYSHYRRQMDELAWFHDLSRLPKGGFSMLPQSPGKASAGPAWGIGMALAYTAPRHTLRITRARPTKHSVQTTVPPYAWGGRKGRDFLRSDYCEGGEGNTRNPAEIGREVWYFLRGPGGSPSVKTCAELMRHYFPHVRQWAANNLSFLGTDEALDEIEKALKHRDARVRRAGMDAISNYLGSWFTADERRNKVPKTVVATRFLPYLDAVLKNPEADWWEIDGAMLALSRAGAEAVRKYLQTLKKYAMHEEMWLRQSAYWAIARGLDQEIDAASMLFLAERFAEERRPFLRNQMANNIRHLTRDSRKETGLRFDPATQEKLAEILARPITDRKWAYGYERLGVSKRDPFGVLSTVKNFHPKDLVHFLDDMLAVIDAWEEEAFLDAQQIGFCQQLIGLSLAMGEDARPLMERIARVYVEKQRMRRGLKKVGAALRKYEEKHGKLESLVEVPLVAEKRDTSSLRKGLIGYWQFDEGAGAESADSSGKNNKAKLKGGAQWADGLFGKCLKVGKSQWAEVPGYRDPVTNDRIRNLSLSFWIRTKDYGSGRIGKGREGQFPKTIENWFYSYSACGAGWDVRLPDNCLYAFTTAAFDGGPHGLTAQGDERVKIPPYMYKVVDDGKNWHHVVMVYDGGRKTFDAYVDGNRSGKSGRWNARSMKGLETENHIIPALDEVLTFGGKFEKDGQVESFDEIAIWDRVITEEEVETLYNNGFGAAIK